MMLARKEEKSRKRLLEKETRKAKEAERIEQTAMNVEFSSSSEGDTETRSDADGFDPPQSSRKPKRSRPTNVVSPGIAATLDRTKVSDRNAVYIIAAAAESLGHSPSTLAINKDSIRRSRHKHYEITVTNIQASFDPNYSLTVHSDRKMLPALMSKELVDHLAVLVSGNGTMKLLGVSKLPNGTGLSQATAVFNLIQEWNLTDHTKFMCFDTTASNTGVICRCLCTFGRKTGKGSHQLSMQASHHGTDRGKGVQNTDGTI